MQFIQLARVQSVVSPVPGEALLGPLRSRSWTLLVQDKDNLAVSNEMRLGGRLIFDQREHLDQKMGISSRYSLNNFKVVPGISLAGPVTADEAMPASKILRYT